MHIRIFNQACMLCAQHSSSLLCPVCEEDCKTSLQNYAKPSLAHSPELAEVALRFNIPSFACLGWYRWPLDSLIRHLKFKRYFGVGQILSHWFNELSLPQQKPDALVAVPMALWRQLGRGFNQSAVLAQHLATGLACENLSHCVGRRRFVVKQQHHSKRNARLDQNMQFTSEVFPPHLKHIVIVDDVLTTGATIGALAQTIRAKNPHLQISCWVMAVTPKSR